MPWWRLDDWPFGKKQRPAEKQPEVPPIFENVTGFLDDEAAQNRLQQDDFHDFVALGQDCDRVPGASGEFGRTVTNPVPVNGPMGQLIYLSRLTTAEATPLIFHRLGSLKEVDVFEVVSEDGRHWDLLYLSMYYPRKSRALPPRYRSMSVQVRHYLIRGINLRLEGFPHGIHRTTIDCTRRIFGMSIADPDLKRLDAQDSFVRPEDHLKALGQLEFSAWAPA